MTLLRSVSILFQHTFIQKLISLDWLTDRLVNVSESDEGEGVLAI